ncbi:hypothetical protein HUU05_08240 [candidate division KSB1 bacterium]|nr:hypothetical protein [candidate division KSB1 bacterium]
MRIRSSYAVLALTLVVLMYGNVLADTVSVESKFDTKTKVRLVKGGIWLEAEISPRAILEALPACDHNADHRLDEDELSQSRAMILSYFATKVQVAAQGKTLTADSTYFAFRSPAALSAMPDRFYIYHWYAMLRPPERLRVRNELFGEIPLSHHHQGTLVSGERLLKFEFNGGTEAASTAQNVVEFQIAENGEATLLAPDDHTLQASYVWAGLGLFGLIFFRLASAARNRWSRAAEAEDDEEEEMTLTKSPVLN